MGRDIDKVFQAIRHAVFVPTDGQEKEEAAAGLCNESTLNSQLLKNLEHTLVYVDGIPVASDILRDWAWPPAHITKHRKSFLRRQPRWRYTQLLLCLLRSLNCVLKEDRDIQLSVSEVKCCLHLAVCLGILPYLQSGVGLPAFVRLTANQSLKLKKGGPPIKDQEFRIYLSLKYLLDIEAPQIKHLLYKNHLCDILAGLIQLCCESQVKKNIKDYIDLQAEPIKEFEEKFGLWELQYCENQVQKIITSVSSNTLLRELILLQCKDEAAQQYPPKWLCKAVGFLMSELIMKEDGMEAAVNGMIALEEDGTSPKNDPQLTEPAGYIIASCPVPKRLADNYYQSVSQQTFHMLDEDYKHLNGAFTKVAISVAVNLISKFPVMSNRHLLPLLLGNFHKCINPGADLCSETEFIAEDVFYPSLHAVCKVFHQYYDRSDDLLKHLDDIIHPLYTLYVYCIKSHHAAKSLMTNLMTCYFKYRKQSVAVEISKGLALPGETGVRKLPAMDSRLCYDFGPSGKIRVMVRKERLQEPSSEYISEIVDLILGLGRRELSSELFLKCIQLMKAKMKPCHGPQTMDASIQSVISLTLHICDNFDKFDSIDPGQFLEAVISTFDKMKILETTPDPEHEEPLTSAILQLLLQLLWVVVLRFDIMEEDQKDMIKGLLPILNHLRKKYTNQDVKRKAKDIYEIVQSNGDSMVILKSMTDLMAPPEGNDDQSEEKRPPLIEDITEAKSSKKSAGKVKSSHKANGEVHIESTYARENDANARIMQLNQEFREYMTNMSKMQTGLVNLVDKIESEDFEIQLNTSKSGEKQDRGVNAVGLPFEKACSKLLDQEIELKEIKRTATGYKFVESGTDSTRKEKQANGEGRTSDEKQDETDSGEEEFQPIRCKNQVDLNYGRTWASISNGKQPAKKESSQVRGKQTPQISSAPTSAASKVTRNQSGPGEVRGKTMSYSVGRADKTARTQKTVRKTVKSCDVEFELPPEMLEYDSPNRPGAFEMVHMQEKDRTDVVQCGQGDKIGISHKDISDVENLAKHGVSHLSLNEESQKTVKLTSIDEFASKLKASEELQENQGLHSANDTQAFSGLKTNRADSAVHTTDESPSASNTMKQPAFAERLDEEPTSGSSEEEDCEAYLESGSGPDRDIQRLLTLLPDPELQEMLKDLADPDRPIRGHGLVVARRLIDRNEHPELLKHSDKLLKVIVRQVQDQDSYCYGHAIRVVSSLAMHHPKKVLELLEKECVAVPLVRDGETHDGKKIHSAEDRVKLGEALAQTIEGLGEMAYAYRKRFVPLLLVGVKDPHPLVKTSFLTNIGNLFEILPYATSDVIHEVLHEVETCLELSANTEVRKAAAALEALDPSAKTQVKKAAATFLRKFLQGLDKNPLPHFSSELKQINQLLNKVKRREKDPSVMDQIEQAHDILNEIIRSYVSPEQSFVKNIHVSSLPSNHY